MKQAIEKELEVRFEYSWKGVKLTIKPRKTEEKGKDDVL